MMEGNIASFLLKKKGGGFFHKLIHRPPKIKTLKEKKKFAVLGSPLHPHRRCSLIA